MRNPFTAAATAAMIFGATAGYAQNATTDEYYLTGEGDAMRVMGGANTEGAVVLGDETYAVPADCPEGSFYRSGEDTLTACGEGGASFGLAEPAAGETRRALTRREGDNRQDTAGGTNTGSGGATTGSGGTSGSNSGQGSGSTDTSTGAGATGGATTSSGSNSGQGSGSTDTSTGAGAGGATGGNANPQ